MDSGRFYRIPGQYLKMQLLDCSGRILDIGGGGEGVIGQLMGDRVIAIDPVRQELMDTPSELPLKIIMDARDLKFLDQSFQTVTSFFTMMFIQTVDLAQVLSEVSRVLKPGGLFYVWDVEIPSFASSGQPGKDVFVVPLTIDILGVKVETGYGTLWPDKRQSPADLIDLAHQCNLDILEHQTNDRTFFLKFRKRCKSPDSEQPDTL